MRHAAGHLDDDFLAIDGVRARLALLVAHGHDDGPAGFELDLDLGVVHGRVHAGDSAAAAAA
jgi:hypothetical protein